MAIALVREYLKAYHREQDILELDVSTATVAAAAQALHTQPDQIAKTLSFMGKEQTFVVVCSGGSRIDNHKFKETFQVKAKMLKAEEVEHYTNHAPGGVCPFALPETTGVYLDVSLRRLPYFYPACGSSNSAIKLTCEELEALLPKVTWVDVCKD